MLSNVLHRRQLQRHGADTKLDQNIEVSETAMANESYETTRGMQGYSAKWDGQKSSG